MAFRTEPSTIYASRLVPIKRACVYRHSFTGTSVQLAFYEPLIEIGSLDCYRVGPASTEVRLTRWAAQPATDRRPPEDVSSLTPSALESLATNRIGPPCATGNASTNLVQAVLPGWYLHLWLERRHQKLEHPGHAVTPRRPFALAHPARRKSSSRKAPSSCQTDAASLLLARKAESTAWRVSSRALWRWPE
jgi:hypothetical protein